MSEDSIPTWLETLADRVPTPGGGAVAALSAALAAGLVGMVSIYTTGPKWADREDEMEAINAKSATLRLRAEQLVKEDEAAFAEVGAAYALPKESDEQKAARAQAIQDSLVVAAQPPRQIIELVIQLMELLTPLAERGNSMVISDVAVAASMARAALEAAIVNVEVNAKLIKDEGTKAELLAIIKGAEQQLQKADDIVMQVRKLLAL